MISIFKFFYGTLPVCNFVANVQTNPAYLSATRQHGYTRFPLKKVFFSAIICKHFYDTFPACVLVANMQTDPAYHPLDIIDNPSFH